MVRDSSRFGLKRSPKETPNPLVELSRRCLEWASRSQPDGTLDAVVTDAVTAKAVSGLLDSLPTGSGVTGDRLAQVRRRLERAEAK